MIDTLGCRVVAPVFDELVTHETTAQFPLQAVDPVKLDETMPGYADTISDHRPVEARLLPIVPRR